MTTENNTRRISVSIADDHKMVVKILSKMINESNIAQVKDVYFNLKSCKAGLAVSLPDVLLLDIGMPDGDGVDFCAEITKIYPGLKIIMLTSYKEFNVAQRALHSGALGYVLKNADPEEIFAGIEVVSQGRQFLCEEIDILLNNRPKEQVVWYSPREKQILQYIADGYTTKEIADKIFRDEETVKSIRKNLLIKIVAKNAFEMVKKACEQNLVRMFLLLFLFLLTGSLTAFAEYDNTRTESWYKSVDSLKQLFNRPLPGKRKIEICEEIILLYNIYEQDSIIFYSHKALDIAKNMNDKESVRGSFIHIGVAYSFKGEYDSAHIYFDKAKELAIGLGNKEEEMRAVALQAFTYAKEGKYNTSIDYFLKVLKTSEDEGFANNWPDRSVMALSNLSEINRTLGNTEIAIQYLKQAEEKCNKKMGLTYEWRMPQIYNEYAFNYLDQGNLDEALRYALKADSINLQPGGVINACYTKGLLATIYLQKNDYDRALQYGKKSFEQADILKDKNLHAYSRKILSDVYMAQHRYLEAENEAIQAWEADSANVDESRAAVENIAMANIYLGNTEKAAAYLKKYSALNDLYSKKSFQTTVSDLSIKYGAERKEMQITSLKKEKILYILTGIAGVLFAVIVGLFSWQKIRREQLKKQLIATDAVLEWEEKERKRFASELHDGINGMLSALKIELYTTEFSIQNLGDKLDECIETIRRISQGMMPLPLERFGMKAALEDFCHLFPDVNFQFFGENQRVEKKVELVIFYCAYELVNNSRRHSGAKNINVQLIQSEKHVSLTVHDDGSGFNREDVIQGSGLKNINNRVISCNGKLDIVSSPGSGTETVIELNI